MISAAIIQFPSDPIGLIRFIGLIRLMPLPYIHAQVIYDSSGIAATLQGNSLAVLLLAVAVATGGGNFSFCLYTAENAVRLPQIDGDTWDDNIRATSFCWLQSQKEQPEREERTTWQWHQKSMTNSNSSNSCSDERLDACLPEREGERHTERHTERHRESKKERLNERMTWMARVRGRQKERTTEITATNGQGRHTRLYIHIYKQRVRLPIIYRQFHHDRGFGFRAEGHKEGHSFVTNKNGDTHRFLDCLAAQLRHNSMYWLPC